MGDKYLAACNHDRGVVIEGLDNALDDLVEFLFRRYADFVFEHGYTVWPRLNFLFFAIHRDNNDAIPQALLSATRGLKPADLNAVVQYAEFTRARSILKKAGAKQSKGREGNG